MSDDPFAILSSVLDGEPVAPEDLAAALRAPDGPEALVDFARLRAGLADDDSRPSPAFYRAMDGLLGRRARPVGQVLRRAAAVVVLALAALGAISLGTRFRGNAVDEPPRATRVIQFTPGVDWNEGAPR